MIKSTFLILLLLCGSLIYAQTDECKVIKAEIAGTYTGDCKKGLAHGKGIAQGIDRYEGHFNKGLPSGTGTYRWANGVYYEGEWKNGLREGEGKMVYPDSVVKGFWKQDKYMGKKIIPPYQIINSLSVSRSTFTKTPEKSNRVKIRIMQGGQENISIEEFSLAYDSGSEYRSGNYYGIQDVTFPVSIKVKYRSWNQLMTSQYNVTFEFVINDPGSWDVAIFN